MYGFILFTCVSVLFFYFLISTVRCLAMPMELTGWSKIDVGGCGFSMQY